MKLQDLTNGMVVKTDNGLFMVVSINNIAPNAFHTQNYQYNFTDFDDYMEHYNNKGLTIVSVYKEKPIKADGRDIKARIQEALVDKPIWDGGEQYPMYFLENGRVILMYSDRKTLYRVNTFGHLVIDTPIPTPPEKLEKLASITKITKAKMLEYLPLDTKLIIRGRYKRHFHSHVKEATGVVRFFSGGKSSFTAENAGIDTITSVVANNFELYIPPKDK